MSSGGLLPWSKPGRGVDGYVSSRAGSGPGVDGYVSSGGVVARGCEGGQAVQVVAAAEAVPGDGVVGGHSDVFVARLDDLGAPVVVAVAAVCDPGALVGAVGGVAVDGQVAERIGTG